jgi:hypothetical protein
MPRVSLLLFASLIAAGCGGGSEKQLPSNITIPTKQGPAAEPVVPKSSDAEAAKFIEGRLAAATGGKPERLEKIRAFRQKATGRWKWPDGSVPVPATREVAAVWPGKVGVKLEFNGGNVKESHLVLRDGSVRLTNNLGAGFVPFEPPNPKDFDAIASVEAVAEQWLPFLLPLTDPQTIVFDLKKQPIDGQMADAVKVAIPRCPPFTLWFDANNGSLGLISYTHVEFEGRPIAKQVALSAYKPFDGLSLPTYIVYRRGVEAVQEWTVSRWEFPEKIEDAAFELKK